MDKFYHYSDIAFIVLLTILAIFCIVAFVLTLKWHTLLFGAMAAALVAAIIDEGGKDFFKRNTDYGKSND